MSERYCPECKQNVEVDKDELKSLVELFEVLIVVVDGLARKLDLPSNLDRGRAMAAKFRKKYLEGK